MKISILSMQRIINYGSFLQAYALKKVLESQGHVVNFIDIQDGEYHEDSGTKKIELWGKIKLHKRYVLRWLRYRKISSQITQNMMRQQREVLGLLDEKMELHKDCQAVVIGSDEIFNCAPTSSWGISTQMFGNIDVPTVISYAASCGYTKYSDIPRVWQENLRQALKQMKCISVRDKGTFDFVKQISGISSSYHIDPVWLYDFDEEVKEAEMHINFDEPYMIVYAYANRVCDPAEIKAIKTFAKKRGIKILCVGGMLTWCDEYPAWSPFEVLAGFKHASYIVTDTFHGAVISAKYNKSFAVLIRESNRNKLNDLMERFSLQMHRVDQTEDLEEILLMDLEYSQFNSKLCQEKDKSMRYLSESL